MADDHASELPSEVRDSPLEVLIPRPAWQFITPGGVAAFAHTRLGRLLVFQFLMAVLAAGVVVWFLHVAWFPTALQAIRALPETGMIADQRLDTSHTSLLPLAQNHFIAIFADTNAVSDAGVGSDLRVGFHGRGVAFTSLLGTCVLAYPPGAEVPFNRIELEPWWGAWQPMVLAMIVGGVIVWLFASWLVLATLYAPVAWMAAYLKDRQLTVGGSWKLSAAALLPAALLCTLAIVGYGLGFIDLLTFLILGVMHVLFGWFMLAVGILALPQVAVATPAQPNPFQNLSAPPDERSANPFSAPAAPSSSKDRK